MSDCILGMTTAQLDGLRAGTLGDRFIVPITLNNAAIKALPTAGAIGGVGVRELVAAVVGKINIPLWALLCTDFTAGAYTNVHAGGDFAAYIGVETNDTDGYGLSYIANIATGSITKFTAMFGSASASRSYHTVDAKTSSLAFPNADLIANLNDASDFGGNIVLSCANGGSGNFTGGHAANTMKIVLAYTQIDVP